MSEETSQHRDKTEARDEILVAALKLFAEKGYFNTSLSDIGEQTGISTGAIYHQFKNKQAIAGALYKDVISSLNNSIDDIRRRSNTPVEQLRAIVDFMFSLAEQAPEVMRFLLSSRHTEFLPEEKPLSGAVPYDKIRKILLAGMQTGDLRRMDPMLAYACFFGVIDKAILLMLDGMFGKEIENIQAEAWTAAWHAISMH